MPTAGFEPATSSLPWMRATYCAKSATMRVETREEASHDLSSVTVADYSSMLVILVYHNTCRYASENRKISKIFDFRKEKGVWGKAPFSVFWRMPKHKKDKKKAFQRFFLLYLFSIHDDNSQDFTIRCQFFCDSLVLVDTFVFLC